MRMFTKENERGYTEPRWGGIMAAAGSVVVLLVLIFGSMYSVGAGERAVEFSQSSGVKEENIGEGLQLKIPFWESKTIYDVKQKKYQVETVGASEDSQDVFLTIVVRYHVDPSWVWWVHQNIGTGYEDIVVRPTAIEAVKKGTAEFEVGDILPNRTAVGQIAFQFMEPKLAENHILLDGIELVDIDFSPVIRDILEEKEHAKQEAIKEQNLLAAREAQAQQQIALAQGEAEAARIISEQLAKNPEYIQYLWVQKWNGIMPSTVAGSESSVLLPVGKVSTQGDDVSVHRSPGVFPFVLVGAILTSSLFLLRRSDE